MRLIKQIEQSFVQQIVRRTRQVTGSDKPLAHRVAWLQAMAMRQARRLGILEDRMAQDGISQGRKARIATLVRLRTKAFSYFVSTAKFLVHQEIYHSTIARKPRMFALPDWKTKAKVRADRVEIPFMEFSS